MYHIVCNIYGYTLQTPTHTHPPPPHPTPPHPTPHGPHQLHIHPPPTHTYHWRIEGGDQGGLGPPPLKLVKV